MKGAVPIIEAGTQLSEGLRVLGLLHRSSWLDVYDAWSEERDCRCIVKTPRPDRRSNGLRAELLQEGRLLLRLTHPHLVRAYELREQPRPLLVLETLTGATLARVIERRPLQPHDAALMGRQLCSALRYLHREGVLHLDLKPDNMVVQGGILKLIDLSIARPPGRDGQGIGTPAYMAPEQLRGGHVSAASDVWGAGAVLFESLTGRVPRHGFARARRASALRLRSGPLALRRIVEACLEPRPRARPTLDELSTALKSVA